MQFYNYAKYYYATLLLLFVFIRAFNSVMAFGANIICNKIPGLSPRQRTLCATRPDAMAAVGEADKVGISECQFQFRDQRWNCTGPHEDSLLSYHSTLHNKETAFMSAIRSAAIAHTITQACSQGNLSSCGCDRSVQDTTLTADGWRWGGCSADIRYGLKFSRLFLDSRETKEDSRSLMNLHNHAAGRKATRRLVRTECRCNGVSGSCTMKTCWKTLPRFREIGDAIMDRYRRHSRQVVPIRGQRAMKPIFLKLRKSRQPDRKPRKRDLVYLHKSSTYCDSDPQLGSIGTHGRRCNSSRFADQNSCEHICCGRGYKTEQFTKTWQCNCKFHWCCHVTCQKCTELTHISTCH